MVRDVVRGEMVEKSHENEGVINGKDVVGFGRLYNFLRGHKGAYVGSALEHSVTKDRRLRE